MSNKNHKAIELTSESALPTNFDKEKVQLTKEGVDSYKKELKALVNTTRPIVLQELKEARAQGDLSENADYDAAKDKQAEVETRIAQLEDLLSRVEVISNKHSKSIQVGSEFVLINQTNKKEMSIKLVGPFEADPTASPMMISNETPIGKAVLGQVEGNIVVIETPNPYKAIIKKIN